MNGLLLHFLTAVLSEKITFLWKCLKLLTSIQQKFTCISLKEKQSFPTIQFPVRSEWSAASLFKCCSYRDNHVFWNCLKLLTSIHHQLTSISLKEKQSVPTFQFTVRSEWSVASLSKCCTFRENHFPLKEPWATYKHWTETHMHFSEREAVCSNTSIHCTKGLECCFTF